MEAPNRGGDDKTTPPAVTRKDPGRGAVEKEAAPRDPGATVFRKALPEWVPDSELDP